MFSSLFDLLQLLVIVPPQRVVLLAHLRDQGGNVRTLRLEHLDIFLVLVLQFCLEVDNSSVLGLDDLLARILLKLKLVVQLLWDVHVEKISPLHLDGRIFAATGDSLDLESLVSVKTIVFLDDTPLILLVVEADANVRQLVPGLRADSLQDSRRGTNLLLPDRNLLCCFIFLRLFAFSLLLVLLQLGFGSLSPRRDSFLLAR
mmetsp:Transcript_72332/g.116633  ORF Transcript_72332/g.116633 Transcript_72332/m.116633 type:complete len:202 (-) Transcript_72332:92-697(-)